MARPKGIPKTGGRKPGSLNKRTRAIRERLLRDEELTVESTVEAIRRGLTFDIRRLIDKDGDLRPLHELTEEEAWPIAGIEWVMKNATAGDGKIDRILKVKFQPRHPAVELAAKHLGMLTEKLELSGDDALMQALLEGRRRAAEAAKSPAK